MTLDTPDAELFDQSLSRVAADLRELGDPDSLDVRRARAVGVLADPQYALDLISGREGAAPTHGGGVANLFVHLTPADLEADLAQDGAGAGTGAVSIERLGAATTRLLTDWLGRLSRHGRQGRDPPGPRPGREHSGRLPRPTTGDARAGPARATRTVSFPVAPGTPGPAIWTTSRPTCRSTRAGRRARRIRGIWRRCAGPITGSRPTPPGTTPASTTVAMHGPHRPDSTTTSRPATAAHPRDPARHDRQSRHYRQSRHSWRSSSSHASADEPDRPSTPTPARSGPLARPQAAKTVPRRGFETGPRGPPHPPKASELRPSRQASATWRPRSCRPAPGSGRPRARPAAGPVSRSRGVRR